MRVGLFFATLFALSLSSCIGGYVTFLDCEQAAGLTICSEQELNLEDVARVVEVTEEKIQVHYPEVTNIAEMFAAQGLVVYMVDSDLSTGCELIRENVYRCEQHIGGVTMDEGHTIYVRYRPCLAHTSLAHELLHSIEYFYLGGWQGENMHSTPYLFGIDAENQGLDYKDMVEWKIREALVPACNQ